MSIIEKTDENSRHDHNSQRESTWWEFETSTTLKMKFQEGYLTFTSGVEGNQHIARLAVNGYTSIKVDLMDDNTPILSTLFVHESKGDANRLYPLLSKLLINYRNNPVGDDRDAIVAVLLLFLDTLELRASGKVWQVSSDTGYIVGYYINKEMAKSAIRYKIQENNGYLNDSVDPDDPDVEYILTLTDLPIKHSILHGAPGWW